MFQHTKLLLVLIVILFVPFSSFANNEITIEESEEFKKVWHLDFKKDDHISLLFEFVKTDETVYNWTELITIQILKNLHNMREFYDYWISSLKYKVPKKLWFEKIIFEGEDNIMALWEISHPHSNAQKEIVKIIETNAGLFLIRYTCRDNAEMDEKWVNVILNAQYENTFLISE